MCTIKCVNFVHGRNYRGNFRFQLIVQCAVQCDEIYECVFFKYLQCGYLHKGMGQKLTQVVDFLYIRVYSLAT